MRADHFRSLIIARWPLILLTAYLTLVRYAASPYFILVALAAAAFAVSNGVFSLLPLRSRPLANVRRLFTVTDVIFVSLGFLLLRGPTTLLCLSFILVFIVGTIWREFSVLLSSVLAVSLFYGVLSSFHVGGLGTVSNVEPTLTLCLYLAVAMFYLYVADRILNDVQRDKRVDEERRRAEVMLEISRAVSSSLNTREILYLIVTRLSEVYGARDCAIVRVDAQARTARMLVKSAEPKLHDINLELSHYPELVRAYDSREILVVPGMMRGAETQSLVVVPMRVRNVVLGLLYVRLNAAWSKLSDDDERFFRLMAATAANALRNGELYEEMEHRARTDFLTGLPNHRAFQATLATELGRAQRHNHSLSLLIIDLDFLKGVNDRFGHPTGDMVIRAIAETIVKGCREFDVAARYGGEEFTVILPETPLDDAKSVANRFREMIADQTFPGIGRITASIGVSNFPVNALGKEDLIRVADQALYVAKKNGRNRVEFLSYQFQSR